MKLIDMTAVSLSAAIKKREVSVEEAVKASLAVIAEKEERLNCYVTVDEKGAMAEAQRVQKAIDEGTLTGPLAGVPMAVKDNMCTKGLLTTCSSKILGNFVPTYTAEAVKKLMEAGAVILGKTNMNLRWAPQRRLQHLA